MDTSTRGPELLEKLRLTLQSAFSPQGYEGTDAVSKTIWMFLLDFVEAAVALGVPRSEFDVLRRVYQTEDGVLHTRRDMPCNKKAKPVKLQITREHEMCVNCSHIKVFGYKGFETHPLLHALGAVYKVDHLLHLVAPEDYAKQGSRLKEMQDEADTAFRPLREALRNLERTAGPIAALQLAAKERGEYYWQLAGMPEEVTLMFHQVIANITEASRKMEAASHTDEFRKAFLAELRKSYEYREGKSSDLIPRSDSESLLVLRDSIWVGWIWSIQRAYEEVARIEDWSDLIILKVPSEVAYMVKKTEPSSVIDMCKKVPSSRDILETALVLYEPTERGKLSQLDNAVEAAELV